MSELPPGTPVPPTPITTIPPAAVIDPNKKPGKVLAIAIMTIVSGCLNAFLALLWGFESVLGGVVTFGLGCLFLPIPLFLAVTATLEIIYAVKILATPMKTNKPSKAVAILEICCIVSCSPLQAAAGIISLVFYNEADVKAYFDAQKPQ